MQHAYKTDRLENGDTTALYPRQILPNRLREQQHVANGKPPVVADLFEVLKEDSENVQPLTGAGAAFAAFRQAAQLPPLTAEQQRDARKNAEEFVAHWKTFAFVKKVEEESITRRIDAVLRKTNMQGFKQASMATTWRIKIMWLGLVFFLLAILVYEIVANVRSYHDSPITTKFTLLTPDQMEFPQVYLCWGSPFNRTYVMQHRDQMAMITAFRSRNAVTKGGVANRRKREVDDEFLIPNDDEIARILERSADDPESSTEEEDGEISDHRAGKWWLNGAPEPDDGGSAEQNLDEEEEDGDGWQPQFARLKRDLAAAMSGNMTGGNSTGSGNMTAAQRAKVEQDRIEELLMNMPNISDIAYDFYRQAAYNFDDTFLECEFHSYSEIPLDCKQIIRPILDPNYGMCYLVKLPEDMKQIAAGRGLRLVVSSQTNLYPRAGEGAPLYAGLLVSVNKEYDPFNWLKTLATPGRLTKVDLDASYVELLNLDDDDGPLVQPCIDDEATRSVLKIFNGNYSRTKCQMDCLFQAHRDLCQCIFLVDKSQLQEDVLANTSFCSPKRFKTCIAPMSDVAENASKECRKRCHSPCKSYRYEMRSSWARLRNEPFSHLPLPPNVTASTHLIELHVAYSRKEIAQLIQSPSASMADLISNLGGQINLWMGASIISLLQMAFMAIGFVLWRIYMQIHGLVTGSRGDSPK